MKQLREDGMMRGYTTGSCSAAATHGAVSAAISSLFADQVKLDTPGGLSFVIEILNQELTEEGARCAVRKYSGDDPDITAGTLVFAEAMRLSETEFKKRSTVTNDGKLPIVEEAVILRGGKGVGRVTKPGLACDINEPAINPTPRRMIFAEAKKVMDRLGYKGKMEITISVPEGEELAKKTFNPSLGIVGGISILGTTGIVEPMSEKALTDTIKVEMSVRKKSGNDYIIITPGNYGQAFLSGEKKIDPEKTVKCSNFIGEALEYAQEMKFKGIIFSGHMGKLIKVAGGVMNTHSKYGDRRMEILGECAKEAGATEEIEAKLLTCVMVDAALDILKEENLLESTMEVVKREIENVLVEKTNDKIEIGTIVFTNKYGLLIESQNIDELMRRING